MPICTKCGIKKEPSEFHERKDTKSGKRSHCKDCVNKRNLSKYYLCEKTAKSHHKAARKHSLRVKYGITPEDYEEFLKVQGGVCYICGGKEERLRPRKFEGPSLLCIDHCHKTGKVRKLLCHNCNGALGQVKESIEVLENMIKYIREHEV